MVPKKLLASNKRGNRRYRHRPADNFAVLVQEVGFLSMAAEGLVEHVDDIHTYPEAVALVDDLERSLGELRRLGAMVKNGPRSCENCGGPMGGRADRRYCSPSCRQQAHRARSRL